MPAYLGFDVFDLARPNRREVMNLRFARELNRLDYATGAVQLYDPWGVSKTETTFSFLLEGRSTIAAFKSFVEARKGQAVPFWMPTWQRDLVAVRDIAAIDQGVDIEAINYTNLVFPQTARHHLALIGPNGAAVYKTINAATDNGDGTETLSLSAQVGQIYSKETLLISYLTLVRLADDVAEYHWLHRELVEVSLRFIEVPKEAPAS